ncbi:hypothetical protein TBK1r_49570 [Stieleria magnilauensis]|uniref:Uncharacterized protein n=1 Tax=Stieleria magnilauensis TaxID=2527963 RepID=A0ABX5XWX2_9BACT|nr:hypothetical protein TBK1r_49570 [Planctomycetes bacterium TBK1r]
MRSLPIQSGVEHGLTATKSTAENAATAPCKHPCSVCRNVLPGEGNPLQAARPIGMCFATVVLRS